MAWRRDPNEADDADGDALVPEEEMEGAAVGVTVSILVMVVCAKKKLYVRPQLIRWQLYILVVNSGSVMFSIEAISDSGKSGPASEVVGINTDAVSEISVFNAGKGGAVVS